MKKMILVRTTREQLEPFNKDAIAHSLVKETGMEPAVAAEIAQSTENELAKLDLEFISAPLIRELVIVELLKRGMENERRSYTRLGLPVYEAMRILFVPDKENANMLYNPETVHKKFADEVSKELALVKILPLKLADAHLDGQVHIHDLDYFVSRPFCNDWDLRYFLRWGFKADGTGTHTSIAAPAKHPEVAILHAAKILAAAQTTFSGGQGFDHFNVFMAPYIKGLEYKKVKQLAQMFIYEMSQMYVARGGQVVFSSISLEPGVPKILQNLPAVRPGGKMDEGVHYGDYFDEAQTLFRALMEVYIQGDIAGKMFDFPKAEVKIRKEYLKPEFDEYYELAAQLSAKFGGTYYLNLAAPYMPEVCCAQCCRLIFAADKDEIEDFKNGTLSMGSLQVVTINLPRIAIEAKGDDAKFFELLDKRMQTARDVLLVKREIMHKVMKAGLLPFASQPKDPTNPNSPPIIDLEKRSLSIGFVGLNEALKTHTGHELHDGEAAYRFGLKTIKAMGDIKDRFGRETGHKFGLLQTPAESTANRFAMIDQKKYGDSAYVQGVRGTDNVYYTNSSHIRVSANLPLWKRIELEAPFHALTGGGAILHVFMGEGAPDPVAIKALNEKIATKTLAAYWAITKDLTYCKKCNATFGGISQACPNCGASANQVEYYSRITGYYQKLSGWNPGKMQEWKDRHRYAVTAEDRV